MNLQEIKDKLGIQVLNLNTALDKEDKPTSWMRHWDNDNRVAVSLHKDTIDAIKAGTATTLGIQTESREGNKGTYTAKRIVMFKEAEMTL